VRRAGKGDCRLAIGDQTRFSSLELTCDKVRKAGQCDSEQLEKIAKIDP